MVNVSTSLRRLPRPAAEVGKQTLRRYGVATASRRRLPDFLIIGTKRGGTTSMWNYLVGHPSVLPMFPSMEKIKSPGYFFQHYDRGPRWYRSHFALEAQQRRVERSTGVAPLCGEASPYYMYDARVADRVKELLPHIKLIVQLRDPVKRAYSQYWERVNAGVEPSSFEDALAAEGDRMRGELERMAAEPLYYSRAHDWYSYRARGVYEPQLRVWLDRFPAEQILVLRSEDMYADEQGVLDQVTTFLGLPAHPMPTVVRHNYRPAPAMAADTQAELTEFYAPHNQALYQLLDRDMGWSTP